MLDKQNQNIITLKEIPKHLRIHYCRLILHKKKDIANLEVIYALFDLY